MAALLQRLHSSQAAVRVSGAWLKTASDAGPSAIRMASTSAGPRTGDAQRRKDRFAEIPKFKNGESKPHPRRYELLGRPDVTGGHERPSQRPYGVALEVEKLLKMDKLDDAIRMVTSAPISSQNTVVWTLLIKQAFHDKQPNKAFKLFSDMKKRGFQPTARTFATIFSGYNQLSPAEFTDKQQERVQTLWGQYQSYLESVHSQNVQEESPRYSSRGDNILSPYVPYLELLEKQGLDQSIMPLFQELEESGLLVHDKYVYTTLLLQIARRRTGDGAQSDPEAVYTRNADDTQTIAGKMQAAGAIDAFALTAILRGLIKGNEKHHQFGYDLTTAIIGDISNPDEFVKRNAHSSAVKLEHRLLDLVLELCCVMRKYDVASDLFDALRRSPTKKILTRSHVDYALDALAYQAAEAEATEPPQAPATEQSAAEQPAVEDPPKNTTKSYSQRAIDILEYAVVQGHSGHSLDILPNRATYHRALVTAWRCQDWESASRAVEFMTGIDISQFRQQRSPIWFKQNISSKKSKDKVSGLDAQSMGYLVRTANSLKDPSAIRVAVRLFDYTGFESFFPAPRNARNAIRREEKGSRSFYQFKLAVALQESLIMLLDGQPTPEQRADYKALLDRVKEVKDRLRV